MVKFITDVVALKQTIQSIADELFVTNSGQITTSGTAVDTISKFARAFIDGGIYSASRAIDLSFKGEDGFGAHVVAVSHSGSIFASSGAIDFGGKANRLTNDGTIASSRSNTANTIVLGDERGHVTNSGLIDGNKAILFRGDSGDSYLVNTGTIAAENQAVSFFGPNLHVFNSGTIVSDRHRALEANSNTGALLLENTGEIINLDGSDPAIRCLNANDSIVNSGLIKGDVILGIGDDIFDGRGGSVSGEVYGGTGDDTYYVSNHATEIVETSSIGGTDHVFSEANIWILGDFFENLTLLGGNTNGIGNSLSNIIEGSVGDNVIRGNNGDDSINGFGGDDIIFGNGNSDELRGGAGRDMLRGGDAADVLIAGSGGDQLFGGDGGDSLNGGTGKDVLTGGLGRDTMLGGSGDDTFVFTRIAHSTTNGSDIITDFTSGADRIDLSGMSQNLTYVGDAGFSGTGAEVRATVNGGGDTLIRIDANGNGSTDMKIILQDFSGFEAYDLML